MGRFAPEYVPNAKDNLHCMQACFMMALAAAGKTVTMEEAERLTDFTPKLYTWFPRSIVEMQRLVPGTIAWSDLDYPRLAKEGEAYYREFYKDSDPAWIAHQFTYCSPALQRERQASAELAEQGSFSVFLPKKEDFIKQLASGHVIMTNVNCGVLDGTGVHAGHCILLYGFAGDHFLAHDPGSPKRPKRKIPFETFMKAHQGDSLIVSHQGLPYGIRVRPNDPCFCKSGKKYKKCHGLVIE